jgi:dihydroxyacetone kinase-like protein
MSNALSGISTESLDTDTFINMFESALENVRTVSRAQIGDKTIMDAMLPAINAISAFKGKGATIAEIMQTAAQAAKDGADSTKDLIARHGRAKNLGERSQGHLDAGASSFAIIFQAFAEALH